MDCAVKEKVNVCSSGSLSDDKMYMSLYKLTKATVLFGSPSTNMVSSCQVPGKNPATSI